MLRRLIESPWTYFVGASLLVVLAIASQFQLAIPSRSEATVDELASLADRELNVIFIVVDTLRADRMGMYGYERDTTPVLDELAQHGIVFKHVIAQSSWTKTSIASMWTATNPTKNGILRYNHVLPEEVESASEIFERAGIRTAGIWRNSWVAKNFGFGQGFDTYIKPTSTPQRREIQRARPSSRSIAGSDADLTDSAVAFLRNFGHDRFMLYMHFMDLHQYVYDTQAPDFGNSYSDAYDKSVNWTDRAIGGFLYEVDQLGLLENSVVIISSDHGEAFQEHGVEGHAHNLYVEVAEVPFIIILPVLLEPGIVVEPVVANIDLWPTILELVGLPPMQNVDGVSLMPLVLEAGGARSQPSTEGLRRPIFAEVDRRWGHKKLRADPLVSVTDEERRAFFPVRKPELAELYDRVEDPAERENLAAEREDELQHYRGLAEAYLADDEPPWGVRAGVVELGEMQLNQLKALGYHVE